MDIRFVNVWMLALLWIVPLIGAAGYWAAERRERALARFMSDALRRHLGPARERWRRHWQLGLLTAGLLLMVLALARPQWGMREETVYQRGRNLLLALDVSRSMLARDVHPNRLERAKVDLMDLIRTLRGDRVGLIAFRNKAVLLCPLTTDYAYLSQALDYAGIESAPAGETNVGDAIRKALAAFESDPGSHNAVVLVSDGEDLSGQAEAAAEEARKQGVAIFTVGLGNPAGSPIPSPVQAQTTLTYQGQEVITKLEHETLRSVAEKTGGAYVPVGIANVDLGALYRDHLSRIAAQELGETLQRRYLERYQLFLFPGILCVLAAVLLSRGRVATTARRQSVPSGAPPSRAVLGLAVLCFGAAAELSRGAPTNAPPRFSVTAPPPTNAFAASAAAPEIPAGRAGGRLAQKLYLTGRYGAAAEAYLAAARHGPPVLENDMLYNAGCALYKAGRYAAAAETFRDLLLREKAAVTAAAYNRGVALFQASLATNLATEGRTREEAAAELLRQSGEAFQRALRQTTDDRASRESLAAVAARLADANEQAKIARLMRQHGQTPPGQLTDSLLEAQRALVRDIPAAYTNPLPVQIDRLEALAAKQSANTDLLIPLKGKLLAALSPAPAQGAQPGPAAQQNAALQQYIEATRIQLNKVSLELRDLDRGAYGSARAAEGAVYNLWKMVADFPQVLREDLLQQTNLIVMTTGALPAPADEARDALTRRQTEARSLTELFAQRFSAAVPESGLLAPAAAAAPAPAPQGEPTRAAAAARQAAQNTTNAPPLISAENRAKILDLAGQAAEAQQAAALSLSNASLRVALEKERLSYRLLKDIEDLLPKNKPQSQAQQPQEQQQDREKQNQDRQQQQPQQQPPQPQEQQEQPSPKEQPQAQTNQPLTPEDIERILEKARQREKDHQNEIRQRETYMPLPPIERDW